jgi:lipoyl(octanoyl) transferase
MCGSMSRGRTLGVFGIDSGRREGRIGIWVEHDGRDEKIAAIGVRVRRWVTYHGLALNVNPNLTHFSGIVPCGLPEFGVTSMHALGVKATMEEVDQAFRDQAVGLMI